MKTYQQAMKDFQRKYFLDLLLEAGGSVMLASIIACMNRTELYRALRRHDIDLVAYKDMRIDRSQVSVRKKEMMKQI